MNLQEIQKIANPILAKHNVATAAIFGSFARNEMTTESDIDILIEFSGKKTLLDLLDLKFELEDVIEKKIDLVTYNGLHHLLKDKILKEQKIIYEQGT